MDVNTKYSADCDRLQLQREHRCCTTAAEGAQKKGDEFRCLLQQKIDAEVLRLAGEEFTSPTEREMAFIKNYILRGANIVLELLRNNA